MDMFKLLTRSTNIQKSAPASKKISGQVPSAGFSGDLESPSRNGDDSHIQGKLVSQGVKRKRTEAGKEQGYDISEPLNFFTSRAHNGPSRQDAENINGAYLRGRPKVEPEIRSLEGFALALSEEECRRTLKRHKIKITILERSREAQVGNHDTGVRLESTKNQRKKNSHTQLAPQPLISFGLLRSKYGMSRRLAENLDVQGYTEPTEVQMGSLPILLGSDEDRGLAINGIKKSKKHLNVAVDLLTVAPTGSGKTLGFILHVLHGLLEDRRTEWKTNSEKNSMHQVQALIIAPTHELADQIVNEGRKLAFGTGVRISGLRKGMRLHSELAHDEDRAQSNDEESTKGEHGPKHLSTSDSPVKADILVSTPLLLLHAISVKDSILNPLPNVRFLVLDEADVLLDPLFREQTLGIWTACTNPALRTSLWSATIGSSIESLAQSFILERRRNLGLKSSKNHHIIRLVVGLKDSAIPNISHCLVYAASEQGKLLALRQLFHPSATPTKETPSLQPPFLIFTQTIPRAIALYSELLYDIPPEAGGSSRIAVLHSDLSDTARLNVMAGFRKGEIWILITTDLLSRGVDFRGMNGVVNYDIPNTGASYVHRVGRTGRQGREGGVAVTLYTKEDIPYVKNVANVIAASQRASGKSARAGNEREGLQKWLLDALPDVSKKTKKELKSKGVESRRTATAGEEGGREARKMRISTKSGYERRLENKRKGAVEGSQRRQAQGGVEEEEWGGFDD